MSVSAAAFVWRPLILRTPQLDSVVAFVQWQLGRNLNLIEGEITNVWLSYLDPFNRIVFFRTAASSKGSFDSLIFKESIWQFDFQINAWFQRDGWYRYRYINSSLVDLPNVRQLQPLTYCRMCNSTRDSSIQLLSLPLQTLRFYPFIHTTVTYTVDWRNFYWWKRFNSCLGGKN